MEARDCTGIPVDAVDPVGYPRGSIHTVRQTVVRQTGYAGERIRTATDGCKSADRTGGRIESIHVATEKTTHENDLSVGARCGTAPTQGAENEKQGVSNGLDHGHLVVVHQKLLERTLVRNHA